MESTPKLPRRRLLASVAALATAWPLAALAKTASPPTPAQSTLHAADFGLMPNVTADQSAALQAAVDGAAKAGLPLFLVGGVYRAGNVKLPRNVTISGVGGTTVILAIGDTPVFRAEGQQAITLTALTIDGSAGGPRDNNAGLLTFAKCEGLRLDALDIRQGFGIGLYLDGCSGRVTGSSVAGHAAVGIFANNSHDLSLAQNRVADCGNGGILVWQDKSGVDGTIISGNHISGISARAGGNGQNGNGINIFRADKVIVSDNVISDCDFSAIRANTTNDTIIHGNNCSSCRETAIFSEFGFSGSVISGNIVDGAVGGISITNFDQGGRLAVCSGNIVRNLVARSPTNPDATSAFGIAAQADTAITGNSISAVPGIGIAAGYGAFLRNVLVADNVITDADTGIAVTVADGTGPVRVAGNMISAAKDHAIVGMKWDDIASANLAADAGRFPGVSVEGNVVSS